MSLELLQWEKMIAMKWKFDWFQVFEDHEVHNVVIHRLSSLDQFQQTLYCNFNRYFGS